MTRFDPVDREQATGKARELFDELEVRGTVPGRPRRCRCTSREA